MCTCYGQPQTNPRWGSENRPLKAEAIWTTLSHHCGPQIACGLWVDLGCGCGEIAATLASRVEEIAGIDPERWARWDDLAREHHNLTFIQGGYADAPPVFAPGSADVVICNQVYEHVPKPVELIRFIHLILKPGGHCYFAGPNLLFPIEPHVFWPFVHWLPRRFATWLMRACGAPNVIDADSTTFWMLRRWLSDFEITNALPAVLRHPQDYARTGVLPWILSYLPTGTLNVLTPISPGFVFILRKPAGNSSIPSIV